MSRASQKKACDVARLSPYADFWETCCRALSGKPPLVRSLCQNAQPLLEPGGRLEAEQSSVPIVARMLWRYFTVLSCGRNQYDVSPPDGRLCLTFIEGQGQNVQFRHREMIESWVAGLVSFDGGLTFQNAPNHNIEVSNCTGVRVDGIRVQAPVAGSHSRRK